MTKPFRIGSYYTRDEIGARFGGTKQWYLPTVDSKVVAVCLRKEHNPKAPNVVLCGSGPKIAKTGEWLAAATWTLPVFVKEAENRWQLWSIQSSIFLHQRSDFQTRDFWS